MTEYLFGKPIIYVDEAEIHLESALYVWRSLPWWTRLWYWAVS